MEGRKERKDSRGGGEGRGRREGREEREGTVQGWPSSIFGH